MDVSSVPLAAVCANGPVTSDSVLLQFSIAKQSSPEIVISEPALSPRARRTFVPSSLAGISANFEPQGKVKPLDLCHHTLVRRTCGKLSAGLPGSNEVKKLRLQSFLSASADLMRGLWKDLGFAEDRESVKCSDLCDAVIRFIDKSGEGELPPHSDVGCFYSRGIRSCNVSLTPAELVRTVSVPTRSPDNGPRQPDDAEPNDTDVHDFRNSLEQGSAQLFEAGSEYEEDANKFQDKMLLVQHSFDLRDQISNWFPLADKIVKMESHSQKAAHRIARRRKASIADTPVLHFEWEAVERLAAAFRVFATSKAAATVVHRRNQTSLVQGVAADPRIDDKIAASTVLSKAWLTTILNEMDDRRTGDLRSKWFGGSGMKDAETVRDRVHRTMNFIERELQDGIQYVYPADDASHTACAASTSGGVVAYVWKYSANSPGYVETKGPICNSQTDPFSERCGIDNDGRLFVYLCRRWYEQLGESGRVATLIHEAAHHAGPRDVTYDASKMQAESQDNQLNNAANYERFAQDVAMASWGCLDSEMVSVSGFTCQGGPCTCRHFAGMCDDPTHGETVRRQCKATCGYCSDPTESATASTQRSTQAPMSTTSATSPSTTPITLPTTSTTTPAATSSTTPVTLPTTSTTTPAATSSTAASTTPAEAPSSTTPVTAATTPLTTTSVGSMTGSTTTPNSVSTTLPGVNNGDCYELSGEIRVRIGWSRYKGSCRGFAFNDMCDQTGVKKECPVSCGVCSKPGCSDDPNFAIETSEGVLTCKDWRQYVCWESVKVSCPAACEVERCSN